MLETSARTPEELMLFRHGLPDDALVARLKGLAARERRAKRNLFRNESCLRKPGGTRSAQ
jgi:hypothetical protein